MTGEAGQTGKGATELFAARVRAGLYLTIVSCAAFALADLAIGPSEAQTKLLLLRAALAAIAAALLLGLRLPAGRRQPMPIAITAVAAIAGLTAWSGTVSENVVTTRMVLFLLALVTATALPWGLVPQVATIAIVVVASLAQALVLYGSLEGLEYGSVGLGVGLLVSGWIAYELERSRGAQAIAAAALRQSEEKFRTIASGNLEPMSLLRFSDGTVLEVNDAWLSFVALSRDEVIGRRIGELPLGIDPADLSRIRAGLRKQRAVEDVEIEIRTAHGQAKTGLFSAVRLTIGDEPCVLAVARDISRGKAVDQIRAELVAMLTHDIKNPLAVIEGFVELLLEGGSEMMAEERRNALVHIGVAARRAMMLAANFLDATRIESQALVIRKSPVDLAEIARHVVKHQGRLAEMRRVKLEDDLPPGLMVGADTPLLERILENVVNHAIHHSPKGGTVRVAASRIADSIELCVEDDGPEIDPTDVPGIFGRDGTASKRGGGDGLGLFVVKMMTEAHGGSVLVENRESGSGTRFRLRLPAVSAEPSRTNPVVAMSS